MGCPGGINIYSRFSSKTRTSMYISREKGDHDYIQTRHNDLFFVVQSFSRIIGPKRARNFQYWYFDASISDRAHAPWAPHNTR